MPSNNMTPAQKRQDTLQRRRVQQRASASIAGRGKVTRASAAAANNARTLQQTAGTARHTSLKRAAAPAGLEAGSAPKRVRTDPPARGTVSSSSQANASRSKSTPAARSDHSQRRNTRRASLRSTSPTQRATPTDDYDTPERDRVVPPRLQPRAPCPVLQDDEVVDEDGEGSLAPADMDEGIRGVHEGEEELPEADGDDADVDMLAEQAEWLGGEDEVQGEAPTVSEVFANDQHVEVQSSSKRRAQQQNEAPEWVDDAGATASPDGNNVDADEDPDATCPRWSDIVDVPGKRELQLMAQSTEMQELMEKAIDTVIAECCFEEAIRDSKSSVLYYRSVLVDTALQLGHDNVAQRMQAGGAYTRPLERYLMVRLSNFRGLFKSRAAAKVQGFYDLPTTTSPASQGLATALLDKSTFMFPLKADRNPDGTRPFSHRCIVSVLQDILSSSGFMSKYSEHFTSSLSTAADELELPIPMVALATTAVALAIKDFNISDEGRAKVPFSVEAMKSRYCTYVRILHNLKATSLLRFHRLMANLYIEASGGGSFSGPVNTAADMEIIDIEAMPA